MSTALQYAKPQQMPGHSYFWRPVLQYDNRCWRSAGHGREWRFTDQRCNRQARPGQTRPDQTRQGQTRPDKTRPDQARTSLTLISWAGEPRYRLTDLWMFPASRVQHIGHCWPGSKQPQNAHLVPNKRRKCGTR